MSNEDENTHWAQDAKAIIQDVGKHVHYISIANLPRSNCNIFFNLTTLEMKDFCLELSAEGFKIVGEKHDSDEKRGKYSVYETPYSLLDSLSPAYRASFGAQLMMKLTEFQENQKNEHKET